MKDLLERAIHQLDKIDDKMESVDKTLVRQEENLREHMRRTELLEIQHEDLKHNLNTELEPVKSHINQVKGAVKILSFAIPIIGAIAGAIYKYLH
jgi:phage-related tail protein